MTHNKNHHINKFGREFFTAQVVDEYDGCTYDMTVIFMDVPDRSPILVSYYYGEPDLRATDIFTDNWLEDLKLCKDVVDAYWLTNHEVLEGNLRSKAKIACDVLMEVTSCLENF